MAKTKKILVTLGLLGALGGIAISAFFMAQKNNPSEVLVSKETIRLWYSDDSLTDYLNSAAVSFGESHEGIRVLPVLVSGTQYLEAVNRASIEKEGEETPDLYLASNDLLEKAYLAGLAWEVPEEAVSEADFPKAAINAVTYKGKKIAYPMYYQTSAFLYNKTYLDQMEDSNLPSTIAAIETYADEHDAPEGLESFFTWDVSDIFYNYFFVGNYLVVGGDAGDNPEEMNLYNMDAIECLKVYQELNQFFSIDTEEVDYTQVLEDFMAGKIMFTVATTDVVATLEQAAADGTFPYEYGITVLPDVSDERKTRSMSVTEGVVINGFSGHKESAAEFAEYLVKDYGENLFDRTGKVSACKTVPFAKDAFAAFMKEYEASVPLPKLIEAGNLWVQLEIAFTEIWEGKDANTELRKLSEAIMTHVTGEAYTETPIEEPKEAEETVEDIEEMDSVPNENPS